jgi:hypothetical protein
MLLQRNDSRGYPIEYLQARIRVRRTGLVDDWQPLLMTANPLDAVPGDSPRARPADWTAEGIWKALSSEYAWVYRSMDDPTRRSFAPFFTWFEMKTLVQCLRIRGERKTTKVKELLSDSLLAESVKGILADEEDLAATVAALETLCIPLSPAFCGLRQSYERNGLQGLEQVLNDILLERTVQMKLHPVLRDFMRCLIDFRNLMHLYKLLRWKVQGPPVFLRGGVIDRVRLDEVFAGREPAGIAALLSGFAGTEREFNDSGSPEKFLLGGITRFLRRRSCEPSGCGLILDYLWCSYVETVNLGILCNMGNIDRGTVSAELIQ